MSTDLARLRLAAQGLVGPPIGDPAAVVRWLLCAQGQDFPGALLAVALRAGSTRQAVTEAMDDGRIVRSWPMRGTLHLVAAEDLPWLLALLTPAAIKGVEKRREIVGLTEADLEHARGLAVELLGGGGRLARAELLAALAERGALVDGPRGYHVLWWLSQTGTLVMGPTRDGEQQFVLLDEWVPAPRRLERDEALAELVLRYFRSHGPATVKDLVRWAGVGVRDVKAGLAVAGGQLASMTVDGVEHWLDPATPERLAAAGDLADSLLLLPGFDELVLGYADRSCTVPAEFAQRIVPGGNGMFRPTVVHGGQAVAVWRTGRTKARAIEVEPFTELAAELAERVAVRHTELP